jgi:hypothetical protein
MFGADYVHISRLRKSLGSYRRACIRSEAPPGYDLFYYKDKGTKTVAHMLDFQEYGVTKKWVIITEISKEVENNSIARINVYTRQYVTRSVGGGESEARAGNGDVGSSGRS